MNVIITGTSSGLGEELKNRFDDDRHNVLGTTHNEELVNEYQWHLDLTEPTSIREFSRKARIRMNQQVDVLINNAGINSICEFAELTPQFISEVMAVNCIGPVMLIQHLLEPLRHKRGTVINIVSDAAWRPMRHSLAYNISKAAIDMATKQMARELTKPTGVSFIGVRPGKMEGTGMSQYIDAQVCTLRNWTPDEAKAYAKAGSVTGLETPTHVIANLIYHLCITDTTRYLSGACIDLVG